MKLSITDILADILDKGLHAGFCIGGLISEDMVAINLGEPLKTTVVASPDYLEKYGIQQELSELLNYSCLRYRFPCSGQIAP